jgi:hypothetical protein
MKTAKRRSLGRALAVVAMLVLTGCGKDSSGGSGDLSGTWGVIGSRAGDMPVVLTVTIDSQHIEVLGPNGSFVAKRSGTGFIVTYSVGDKVEQVLTPRENGGSMSFGALPLDLSGRWSFRTPDFTDGVGCDVPRASRNCDRPGGTRCRKLARRTPGGRSDPNGLRRGLAASSRGRLGRDGRS